MSASIDVRARMSRLQAPQGALGMSDVANEFTRKMAELRLRIAAAKVDQLVQRLDAGEEDVVKLSEEDVKELDKAGLLPVGADEPSSNGGGSSGGGNAPTE